MMAAKTACYNHVACNSKGCLLGRLLEAVQSHYLVRTSTGERASAQPRFAEGLRKRPTARSTPLASAKQCDVFPKYANFWKSDAESTGKSRYFIKFSLICGKRLVAIKKVDI